MRPLKKKKVPLNLMGQIGVSACHMIFLSTLSLSCLYHVMGPVCWNFENSLGTFKNAVPHLAHNSNVEMGEKSDIFMFDCLICYRLN